MAPGRRAYVRQKHTFRFAFQHQNRTRMGWANKTSLGNAARFAPVRGFWGASENVSLAKTFRVTEPIRFDLRREAFNALNRVVFSSPTANLNNLNFGRATRQANSLRQRQVALKIYW